MNQKQLDTDIIFLIKSFLELVQDENPIKAQIACMGVCRIVGVLENQNLDTLCEVCQDVLMAFPVEDFVESEIEGDEEVGKPKLICLTGGLNQEEEK